MGTVLVVDAEPRSRSAVVHVIQRLGYRVLQAADGANAQRLARAGNRIDLVLAEFAALGTSGVELIRWFSANRPDSELLVLADWLWEVESCLCELPRVGILAKPFAPSELARMVNVMLGRVEPSGRPRR